MNLSIRAGWLGLAGGRNQTKKILFLFKVLAKFGEYKDNKDIKKSWIFEFFLSNALPGWLGSDERWINPTIFIFFYASLSQVK